MGFVLELQEPFLGPVIDVHIDENAACVVLLAHLQVVEQSLAAQVTGTDRRQVHQADALALAPQFAADFQVKRVPSISSFTNDSSTVMFSSSVVKVV